ncbi:hypothetical protein [Nocardioides mangrovi]|uniref:PQQ-binding-like beta-propeller repeat protein n=1 Tax=Nocardioides mangrovi TaxID=2874580 RepID=A0ABS7UAQ7_9ACTN|nr:hypothetical protein [Nocardioides mangrovi]MBZ5737897.1 hypothetical protein [Nocardioides mangrovi]
MWFARTAVLVGVGLLCWALGPLVLLLGALSLLHPRVRAWLRPTRRVVLVAGAVVLVLAGVVWLVPDGWVRVPPGAGTWVTPSYVGRPTIGDGELGPGGESPQVRTRFYGLAGCQRLDPVAEGRLVTVCGDDEPVLRLVDADSLHQQESVRLPGSGCTGRLAVGGGRVVASSGRQVLTVGVPDLVVDQSVDLAGTLGDGDCVTGLAVDGDRTWFASRDGVVGAITGTSVASVDIDDEVARPIAVDAGTAYVAGATALHRVGLRGGKAVVDWSAAYDSGTPGSAPVPLPGGLVATAMNRDPRLQVVVHSVTDGGVVCRAEVFDDDEGATDDGMVAAGSGVVVQNSDGYAGVRSTILGRTTSRGIARVEVAGGECRVAWTTDMDAPSGTPAVSADRDLVYVWAKRHSWLGVDAWYLSALDLGTGRLSWASRVGLGPLLDNHHGVVTLDDGAAYAPVLGGLVRVADRS